MPKRPPGPDSVPTGDTHHPDFGNPLLNHPEVDPAYSDRYARPEVFFVELTHEPTVGQSGPSYDGDPDDDYDVTATPLPVLRPEDLESGLLMYHPGPDPRTIYELAETASSDETRTSSTSLTVNCYRADDTLWGQTSADLDIEQTTTTYTIAKICRTLTVLQADLSHPSYPS